LKGLRALQEEQLCHTYIVIRQEPEAREKDGIRILPWQKFLSELWAGSFA
jgi:hypothetical protein